MPSPNLSQRERDKFAISLWETPQCDVSTAYLVEALLLKNNASRNYRVMT